MNRSEYLANRIREVLMNGKWIANTNYKEQLLNSTYTQATHKSGNLNTIAALTFHINYYLSGLIKVFEGGTLDISDQFSFNITGLNSEMKWNDLVNDFLINSEKFSTLVEQMPESKLDEIFTDARYVTFLRNIEGFIEHSYYHLGQIVLIKKIISENNN